MDIAMRTLLVRKYPKILRETMTLQVSQSAHQDTVAFQAISRGMATRITWSQDIGYKLNMKKF